MTSYTQIEKWWEIVFSAYLMVALQFDGFVNHTDPEQAALIEQFRQHCWWSEGKGWKRSLNNLHLLIQPFIFLSLIKPWLQVFEVPWLKHGFTELFQFTNAFTGWIPGDPHRFFYQPNLTN
jgi:hypothetical protein